MGRGGGSERPSFIKAAGAALPARPCRLDRLRSPQPHVIATTRLHRSELGGVPTHPQTFAEMRALLNQGGKETPMKEGAEMGVPGRIPRAGIQDPGEPGDLSPPPARGLGDCNPAPGMRVQPFPW